MCGIVGWIGHSGEMRERGQRALDLLAHRGPDAGALWIDDVHGVALGSRRLAILDLRRTADQPMTRDGSVLVHNGEIYNYVELRESLRAEGELFATGSDTEVILAAFARWGERAVERFNGMFAFALWDPRSASLTLARDRFGEKPMYHARGDGCLHFASEIKALLAFPCVRRSPDMSSVYDYLATGRMPDGTQDTFFEGIHQLAPASSLRIDRGGLAATGRRYWRLVADAASAGLSLDDARDRLGELFDDSVRLRLRSDVPVGTSLSGGIDSSLVAASVARLRDPEGPPQLTFSARHHASEVDEGRFITPVVLATRAVGREVFIEPDDLVRSIDQLVWHQDEPFPHTSMFAQWKVYELARRDRVTVLLDGQGADEIFGGYHSLAFGAFWAGLLRRIDLRGLADEVAGYRALHGADRSVAVRYIGARLVPRVLEDRMRMRRWGSRGLVANVKRTGRAVSDADCGDVTGALHRALCDATLRTSLPGLLRFADRSSMAHSIEVRLPFLDHRVVEFAFGLPDAFLVHRGWSKRILRELLRPELPAIADRRDKIGFATPERAWFTGPLRAWMDTLMRAAGERELFAQGEVGRMWESVLGGRTPSQVAWRVANVELWLRRFFDAAASSPYEATTTAR